MKKTLQGLLLVAMVLIMVACKKGSVPVTVGNVSFSFDEEVWTLVKNVANEPLEFADKNDNKISLNVSKESTYQHPMVMISFVESLVSDYKNFQVFLEPNEITVNGTKWYEYGYTFKDGATAYKVYQRYYGKYYNAASVSYVSTTEKYDAGYDEAIILMSDIKVQDVDNKENEEKAKNFLVGEWDLDGKGYLVLSKDGSYEWFRDSSKDSNNMHYGCYGCDVENSNMNMAEGEGLYLVLFPEALVVDGVIDTALQYKIDYLISLEGVDDGSYKMVNISTYTLYNMTRQ
jgi:hypothetical protein